MQEVTFGEDTKVGVVSCSPDGTSAVVGTSNGSGSSSLLLYDVRTMTLGRNSLSDLTEVTEVCGYSDSVTLVRFSGVGNFL